MEVLKHKIINCLALLPLLVLTACNDLYIPADTNEHTLAILAKCVVGDTVFVKVRSTISLDDKTIQSVSTDESTYPTEKIYPYQLLVNGMPVPHDYIVQQGDEIKVTAHDDILGSAYGSCTMPKPCHNVKADFKPSLVMVDSINYDGSRPTIYSVKFNGILTVEVTDSPNQHDFYSFGLDSYVDSPVLNDYELPGFNFYSGFVDLDNEPIFGEHISEFESAFGNRSSNFGCFTDRQFSGNSYKLHIQIENATIFVYPYNIDKKGKEDVGLSINLSTISPDTYKWNCFLWYSNYSLMYEMADAGLAPYMPAFSNVSTGAGIVTAYTPTYIKISLRDLVEEQLAKFLKK